MGANLFSVMRRKTITNDEIVHIPSGYQYLAAGNFRLNPEHPPLIKMWAALPLLVIKPEPSLISADSDVESARLTELSALEFWQANLERAKKIALWSRIPMILLTLALGALIFVFGRQLFGPRAALFAVVLFSLEPTMLAHGRIVHTDMPAALGYLFFLFAMYSYYGAPTLRRCLLVGLALSFALLTKFSLIILAPIFIAAMAFMVWKAQHLGLDRRQLLRDLVIVAAVVLFFINAAYFFQHPALAAPETDAVIATTSNSTLQTLSAIRLGSKIVPTYFLFGLHSVLAHNRFGHPASLLGQYRTLGWWYYFPVAFALKTTLPFLVLSLTALAWALWRAVRRSDKRVILVLAALFVYLAMAMTSHINIGIRHIAPIFPLLFLLAGAFLDSLLKTRLTRPATLAVAALCGWMIVDAVRTYPDYMSFTSPLTFGKPGWQMLSDSNVEWGEDIGALARYLRQQGETQLVGSLSGGWATPPMYGIELIDFAPPDPQSASTRYVAIGAGFLNGSTMTPGFQDARGNVLSEEQRHDYFARYRTLRPEKVFGNSIYLYRAHE
jgi:hypothetical protein